MLTKRQALEEAKKQKQALHTLGTWRRNFFLLAACLVSVAVWGLQGSSVRLAIGILAAVLTGISLLLVFLLDFSIRNGHRNVEKILCSIQKGDIPK